MCQYEISFISSVFIFYLNRFNWHSKLVDELICHYQQPQIVILKGFKSIFLRTGIFWLRLIENMYVSKTSSDLYSLFISIPGHRRHKDMMPGKHYTLLFLVGITCGFFLQSDAASVSNVNLKIDVNGKTVIDQSYPTSKL